MISYSHDFLIYAVEIFIYALAQPTGSQHPIPAVFQIPSFFNSAVRNSLMSTCTVRQENVQIGHCSCMHAWMQQFGPCPCTTWNHTRLLGANVSCVLVNTYMSVELVKGHYSIAWTGWLQQLGKRRRWVFTECCMPYCTTWTSHPMFLLFQCSWELWFVNTREKEFYSASGWSLTNLITHA